MRSRLLFLLGAAACVPGVSVVDKIQEAALEGADSGSAPSSDTGAEQDSGEGDAQEGLAVDRFALWKVKSTCD